jgi:hypothetical protein
MLHLQSLPQEASPIQPAFATIPPVVPDNGEEVRRNQRSFDSIVSRDLWFREGILDWFHRNPSQAIKFNSGSIEVKAIWVKVNDSDPAIPVHKNRDQNHNEYKLVALHIMTNALPEWTWGTWEWAGNNYPCLPGDSCHDSSGCKPTSDCSSLVPNHPGALTPSVRKMFMRLGLSDEWTGYRLHGSQVVLHRPAGETPSRVLLANSQIEGRFAYSSSCVACHAQAKLKPDGTVDCLLGFLSSTGAQAHVDFPPLESIPPP